MSFFGISGLIFLLSTSLGAAAVVNVTEVTVIDIDTGQL
jgi:hypothetical protein